jgi:hypothetical protein
MRVKYFFVLFVGYLSFININKAQVPSYLWAQSAAGNFSDYEKSVSTDAANNIFTVGYFKSPTITFGGIVLTNADTSGNTYDFYIVKYNSSGNVLWAKRAGGTSDDGGQSVCTDLAGNIIISGFFQSSTITFGSTTLTNAYTSYPDIFILKYDTSGNLLWAKREGGTGWDYGNSIQIDSSNNIILTGRFGSPSISIGTTTLTLTPSFASYPDFFVAKYDSLGNALWAKSASGNNTDEGVSVSVDVSDNIIVTGYFQSPNISFASSTLTNSGGNDIFIVKFDPSGNVIWAKNPSGPSDDRAKAVSCDALGNTFITGYFYSSNLNFDTTVLTNNGNYDIFIAKYNSSGDNLWAINVGGSDYEYAGGLFADAYGNIITTGTFQSSAIILGSTTLINAGAVGSSDFFLAKYNSSGNLIWVTGVGEISDDIGAAVTFDENENLIVTGYFKSPSLNFGSSTLTNSNPSYFDVFVVKLDNVTGIEDPSERMDFTIYPNPTINQVEIQLNHPVTKASIKIFNMAGQIILLEKNLNGNEFTFDLSNMDAGIYIIEISSSFHISRSKLVKY